MLEQFGWGEGRERVMAESRALGRLSLTQHSYPGLKCDVTLHNSPNCIVAAALHYPYSLLSPLFTHVRPQPMHSHLSLSLSCRSLADGIFSSFPFQPPTSSSSPIILISPSGSPILTPLLVFSSFLSFLQPCMTLFLSLRGSATFNLFIF